MFEVLPRFSECTGGEIPSAGVGVTYIARRKYRLKSLYT